jgi:hypothetical protein
MRPSLLTLIAGFSAAIVLLPLSETAQARCPNATTASGACVNPGVTKALRNQAIAYTQQNLSYTAPPRLPSEDYNYLIARNWNEMLQLFTFPPVGGLGGGPAGATPRRP